MMQIINNIGKFLKDIFNLSHEQADHFETMNQIEKGVDFKGVNVWTLIFAIFIASIGLNVNSTAVIIGAMLISPLMGPIIGLGLSVGIFDFRLLKKSLRNLAVAVVISIITSTVYFLISPLSEAQSELLSRTTPTIYDVLIALFGGLAGIVAGSSREKGNAIPGVAIATALMPPLCTAGFGIATGNIYYFIGAFYLFFINAVMISFSAFLIVRFMKFPFKQDVNKAHSNRVRKYIYIIVSLTIIPSIFLAYSIIQETVFTSNANRFIQNEVNSSHTGLINSSAVYHSGDSNVITLIMAGQSYDSTGIRNLYSQMKKYSLDNTKLIIKEVGEVSMNDISLLKKEVLDDILLHERFRVPDKFVSQTIQNDSGSIIGAIETAKALIAETHAINKKVQALSISPVVKFRRDNLLIDTTLRVLLSCDRKMLKPELEVLKNWFEVKLKNNQIEIVAETESLPAQRNK